MIVFLIVSSLLALTVLIVTIVLRFTRKNPTKSTYSWQSSTSSVCSVPCGGGKRYRNVWCEEDGVGKVDDKYCTGSKPLSEEDCNTQPC